MQVLEMHILIEEETQKLSSTVNRYMTPEQRDLHINYCIDKFVEQEFSMFAEKKGNKFEANERLRNALSTLYAKDYTLDPYKYEGFRDAVFTLLPHNCKYLISDNSVVSGGCRKLDKKDKEIKLYITPFDIKTEESYEQLEIYIGDNKIFDLSDYPAFESGLEDMDEAFYIYRLIQQHTPLYYESVYGEYYPKHFLWLSFSSGIESTVKTIIDGNETTHALKEKTLRIREGRTGKKVVPNRLYRGENLHHILNSPYEGTYHKSPVSHTAQNILYVYEDDTFTVDKVLIDYIKYPKHVSLQNKIDSDLPEESQKKVVALAVARIKSILADPSYQTTEIENNKLNV